MNITCSNPSCQKLFFRDDYEISRSKSKHYFCSRSCSAQITNLTPKRIRQFKKCKRCNNNLLAGRRDAICKECKSLIKTNRGYVHESQVTKEDLSTNDTQKYRRIRDLARRKAKKYNLLTKCFICGYSNYVECCHKKSIESFSLGTLISQINDINNLIGLCPNHHWELDNNIIKIPVVGVEPT